jgi:hypothetical protein
MSHSRTDLDESRLFIVYVDGTQRTDVAEICDDAMQLTPALCLVRTSESQSRLYHRIKRHAHPRSLFVGPLEEQPKFKGMSDGALKWVRALEGVFEKT